jgi:hypothetical protein
LVTTCLISAVRNIIPLVYGIPLCPFQAVQDQRFSSWNITGVVMNIGWMTRGSFVHITKQFMKHTSSSKENSFLVLINNQESHLPIATSNPSKEYKVTGLIFHLHCPCKLRSQDDVVYFPFKAIYNVFVPG